MNINTRKCVEPKYLMKQPVEDVRNSSRGNYNHKPRSLTASFLLTNSFFTAVSRVQAHVSSAPCHCWSPNAGLCLRHGPGSSHRAGVRTLHSPPRAEELTCSHVSCTVLHPGLKGIIGLRGPHIPQGGLWRGTQLPASASSFHCSL